MGEWSNQKVRTSEECFTLIVQNVIPSLKGEQWKDWQFLSLLTQAFNLPTSDGAIVCTSLPRHDWIRFGIRLHRDCLVMPERDGLQHFLHMIDLRIAIDDECRQSSLVLVKIAFKDGFAIWAWLCQVAYEPFKI